MKYYCIDYIMPFPFNRLGSPFFHLKMLIMSLNEHFKKQNSQLIKFQLLYFLLGIKRRYEKNFFSLLNA